MVTLTSSTSFSLPFDETFSTLPLAELVRQSAEEGHKFSQRMPNNSTIILALFYRAFSVESERNAAWAALYHQYFAQVVAWIKRHSPSFMNHLVREEVLPSLVNDAFTRFARSLSPEKIQHFQRLAELLRYFELCTRSVLADHQKVLLSFRSQQNSTVLSWEDLRNTDLEPIGEAVEERVEHQYFAEHFWTVIDDCVGDEECLLLHLMYLKQMKPEEISRDYSTHFATPRDVYRIKHNILQRLVRSRKLKRFLAEYDALPTYSCAAGSRKDAS